jgi:hypothetical protein
VAVSKRNSNAARNNKNEVKRGLWSQLPSWFQKTVALSGWAAALLIWVLQAPASINSFFAEAPKAIENVATWWNLDKQFTGTWSNEANIDIPPDDVRLMGLDGAPIAIELRVYGGTVDGYVITGGLGKHWMRNQALIAGNVVGGKIEGYVYDFHDGKREKMALIEITHSTGDQGDFLYIKALDQPIQFLPDEGRVYRVEASYMPTVELNMDFFKQVEEEAKKMDEAAKPGK